jgi:hypothetical protein
MPSVKGSSSSLIVAVDFEGTHPKGTRLCSQRCVQPKPLFGTTSEGLEDSPFVLFSVLVSSGIGGNDCCLRTVVLRFSFCTLSVKSENPRNGLIGVVGVEFRDTTVGGDVKDAGARTVKDRSSEVKFDA